MPISRIATFFTAFFLSCAFFPTAPALAFETVVEPVPISAAQASTQDKAESNFWLQNHNDFDVELNYDRYSVAEGLSQSIVTSIVKDKEGYLWIGTVNGLNRFDGTHFKHFFSDDNTSNLPSSFIRSLALDPEGKLLVGTDAGLVQYDPESEDFITKKYKDFDLTQPIRVIEVDGENIFIGLENSVIVLDKNSSTPIKSKNLKDVKKIKLIKESLFIRNNDGDIFEYKKGFLKKILRDSVDMEKINGKLMAATSEGLFSYNKKIKKLSANTYQSFTSYDNKLFAISELDLIHLSESGAGTKIGTISEIKKHKKTFLNILDGDIYVSIMNSGFVKSSHSKNLLFKVSDVTGNIWSIIKHNNNIYVASDSNVIKQYSDKFKLVKEIETEAALGPKSMIIVDNNLLIGSHAGLINFNLRTFKSHKINDRPTFHLSEFDGEIISGSNSGEIVFFDQNLNITKQYNLEGKYPIYDIFLEADTLWVASQSGLINISNGQQKTIYNKDLVTTLEETKDKVIFGTRTSLFSVDKKSHSYSKIHSYNKFTYSIKNTSNLLISASNGEVAIYNKHSRKAIMLTAKHGAQLDYNLNATLMIDNILLLGGAEGISAIKVENIENYIHKNKILSTAILNFSLFNINETVGGDILKKSINTLTQIELKSSDYPFSLKFTVPGVHVDDIAFYYQMKGLSNDWLAANEVNSATYTNLSHGEYTFNVYAIDKVTGQKGPKKSINIIITPPWWLSIEAKFIYALLTILLVSGMIRAILRRREIQRQIALSEERLKLSLWGSGDEMWDWDIESGKIFRSNIWGTLEFPQDGQRSSRGVDGESNIHPQDQARVQQALDEHFQGKTDHFEVAYRVKNRNNEWLWILDRAKIVERDNNDRPLRMTGTIKDINNIKQTEEQLRLFARAIENISEGMFILDANHQFVEVNSACCSLLQRTKSSFTGELLSFNLYPESFSTQIRSIIAQQGYWSGEVDALKSDDSTFLMSLTIDAIKDELGQFSHYVGIFSDITRRKQQEEELRKLTNNDILTGLANRSSLQVTLSNLVKKDIHHTLMVLDLDNFKRINDSLGHQIGDSLIISVAKRIQATIPSHASLYRLGGDEFAILLDKDPDIASSAAIAGSIIDNLKTPFSINSAQLVVGLSIGIVLYPEDEQNEQALLRKADIAMYHAKSAGGNRYQFYAESLNQNVLRQLEVENLIRQGLKEDLFEVHYQAKVDLKLDRITGMEALVRLNHPQLGLIPPNDFIPLAEDNGLIIEIGDIVLRKACYAAQSWRQQGIFNGRIAVNLSSKQFALPDLVQRIESILRLTGLPAAHLELEITEGTVIKNPESAIKVMQQLSKMGISLALDDFGTGYSSLSYLKRFPIHRLKVDKSFVDDIDKSEMDLKMVDSIITIAHNMGLTVVGEGVEQASQLAILRALNCEEIQGYIFSKPITEQEFTLLLNTDALKDKKSP